MKDSDSDKLAKVLAGVYGLYGKDWSKLVLSVWIEAMRPFDFEAVKDALNRHCVNPDNGQFLPKPADVVKLIGGGTQDGALLAWTKVDRSVRSVGTYDSACFDDPIINQVLQDMGGWIAIGQKTEEEWPFVSQEFQKRYRAYRLKGKLESWPKVLPGIIQRDRGRDQGPVMIGDPERASRVHRGGSAAPQLQVSRPQLEGPKGGA